MDVPHPQPVKIPHTFQRHQRTTASSTFEHRRAGPRRSAGQKWHPVKLSQTGSLPRGSKRVFWEQTLDSYVVWHRCTAQLSTDNGSNTPPPFWMACSYHTRDCFIAGMRKRNKQTSNAASFCDSLIGNAPRRAIFPDL